MSLIRNTAFGVCGIEVRQMKESSFVSSSLCIAQCPPCQDSNLYAVGTLCHRVYHLRKPTTRYLVLRFLWFQYGQPSVGSESGTFLSKFSSTVELIRNTDCSVALTDPYKYHSSALPPLNKPSSLCAGLTCDDECTYDCTWITTQIMQRRFKKVAVFILTFFTKFVTCHLWHELTCSEIANFVTEMYDDTNF
jgi:hypothetical protein